MDNSHIGDNSHITADLTGQDENFSQCVLLTVEGSIALCNVQSAVNSFEEEGGGGESLTLHTFFTPQSLILLWISVLQR